MTTIFDTQKYNTFTTPLLETNKDKEENQEEACIIDKTIITPHTPLERVKYYEELKKEVAKDTTEEVYGTLVTEKELPLLPKEESITKYIYLEDRGTFYDTATDMEYVKTDVFRRKLSIELDKKITDDEVRYMIKSGEIAKRRGVIYHPKGKEGYYNLFNPRSLIEPSSSPILDEGITILLSSIVSGDKEGINWLHRAILYKWANPEDVRVPCPILYGVGGSGKSTFIDFLKAIFGGENVMGNLRQSELTGNFDTVTGDKLIYEFSEITAFNSNTDKQMLNRVKGLVFAPTITVHKKFKDQIQNGNYGWFFLTSNSMRPLIFDTEESGNRRFVAFRSKKALTVEEANKVYRVINNPETIANYLAWLHQEHSEVLDYKEMYRIENDDMRLLVQNSSSEVDELVALLKERYNGKRVHVGKITSEVNHFAEREGHNPSALMRLFKAQSPFLRGKGAIEGMVGAQHYWEIQ